MQPARVARKCTVCALCRTSNDATPSCLVLMPLSVNEEINGVIEIASFEVLEGHKLELLKRLAENVAASISTTKINAKTQKLL